MNTHLITRSDWNNPAFWSGLPEAGPRAALDFPALPFTFIVNSEAWNPTFTIYTDTNFSRIAESGTAGDNATLGGSTQLEYFTNVMSWCSNDDLGGDSNKDSLNGGAGNDTIDGDGRDDSTPGGAGNGVFIGFTGNTILDGGCRDRRASGDVGQRYHLRRRKR